MYADVPSSGGSASRVGLAADVWVLVLVAEVEAEVVDDVASVLYDVGTLSEVLGGSVAAKVLKLGEVVGVSGRREAREDVLLGEEQGTCAHREDSPLTSGVLLLQLREVGNETKGFELLVKNLLGVAANDDKKVKVLEAIVGFLVGKLGADDGAGFRKDLGIGTNNGDVEGLVVCERGREMISIVKEG